VEAAFEKQNYSEQKEYGGFWLRFGAYLIDGIIVGIPIGIITTIIFAAFLGTSDAVMSSFSDPAYMDSGEMTEAEAMDFFGRYIGALLLTLLISTVIAVAYYAGLHASKWQATIGKKLVGLKVTDLRGNRISFWRALGRYFAMAFLSGILLIGFILAAFTERKQALHDMIAGTVVVRN
jgi:uncharacterized RDD family membrane protein YckC